MADGNEPDLTTAEAVTAWVRAVGPEAAAPVLQARAKDERTNPLPYFGLALAARDRDDRAAARNYARQALMRDPGHRPTRELFAPDEGDRLTREALAAPALRVEVEGYAQSGPADWTRVAERVRELVRAHPWYVRAVQVYFKLCLERRDLRAAQALTADLDDAGSPFGARHTMFARVLAACGHPLEAAERCLRSLREAPKHAEAVAVLRSVLADHPGRAAEVLALLRAADLPAAVTPEWAALLSSATTPKDPAPKAPAPKATVPKDSAPKAPAPKAAAPKAPAPPPAPAAAARKPGPAARPRTGPLAGVRDRLVQEMYESAVAAAQKLAARATDAGLYAGLIALFRQHPTAWGDGNWLPTGPWGEFGRWLYSGGLAPDALPVTEAEAEGAAGLVAAIEGRWREALDRLTPAAGRAYLAAAVLSGNKSAALAGLPPLPGDVPIHLPSVLPFVGAPGDEPAGGLTPVTRTALDAQLGRRGPEVVGRYEEAVGALRAGAHEDAEELFLGLQRAAPDEPLFVWGLVLAALGQERSRDASRLLRRLLGTTPEQPHARPLLATVEARLGNHGGVVESLKGQTLTDFGLLALAVRCAEAVGAKHHIDPWLQAAAGAYRDELVAEFGPPVARVTVPPPPPPPTPLPPPPEAITDPADKQKPTKPSPDKPPPDKRPNPGEVENLLRNNEREKAVALAAQWLTTLAGPDFVRDMFVAFRTAGDDLGDLSWVPDGAPGGALFRYAARRSPPDILEDALFRAGVSTEDRLRTAGLVALAERRWADAVGQLPDGPEAALARVRAGLPPAPGAPALDEIIARVAGEAPLLAEPKEKPYGLTPASAPKYQAALERFRRGDFEGSARGFQKVAEAATSPSEAGWGRAAAAVACARAGNLAAAIELVAQAAADLPKDAEVRLMLALLHLRAGRHGGAAAAVKAVRDLQPDHGLGLALAALLALREAGAAPPLEQLTIKKRPEARAVAWAYLVRAQAAEDAELTERAAKYLEERFRFVAPLPPAPEDDGGSGTVTVDPPPEVLAPADAPAWADVVQVLTQPADGKTRFGCHDLFLARSGERPVFLLVDGSAGAGHAHEPDARRRLFHALSFVWPWLAESPEVAFDLLGKVLLATNLTRDGKVFCSAALAVPGAGGVWTVAEVGDTKAFVAPTADAPAAPVWADGLPTGDHRVTAALGTDWPRVRTRRVHVGTGPVLLATDGAYHLFAAHNLLSPGGAVPPGAVERFADLLRTAPLSDDATLVRLAPRGGRWPGVRT